MIAGTETCTISFGGDEIYEVLATHHGDTGHWTYMLTLPPDPSGAVFSIDTVQSVEVPRDADPAARLAEAAAEPPESWSTLGECLADAMRFAADHHTGAFTIDD
jgi:hypothetical protein